MVLLLGLLLGSVTAGFLAMRPLRRTAVRSHGDRAAEWGPRVWSTRRPPVDGFRWRRRRI